VNIVLLSPAEASHPLLPARDERAVHVRKVLRKVPGQAFLAGIEDGPLVDATILSDGAEGMRLSLGAPRPARELHPLGLVLGFPRPIQANRVLKDLCSLGVARVWLCGTDLGERSYRDGSFFRDGGWERAVREGASQAGSPLLTRVSAHGSLDEAIDASGGEWRPGTGPGTPPVARLALDARGDPPRLSTAALEAEGGAILALGSERGWTDRERGLLEGAGFARAGLGARILRTETACLAACAVVLSRMGVM
jgi:RsmE family RNA methyltransferase